MSNASTRIAAAACRMVNAERRYNEAVRSYRREQDHIARSVEVIKPLWAEVVRRRRELTEAVTLATTSTG